MVVAEKEGCGLDAAQNLTNETSSQESFNNKLPYLIQTVGSIFK